MRLAQGLFFGAWGKVSLAAVQSVLEFLMLK